MTKLTRRNFLRTAAAGLGTLSLASFLEACGRLLPDFSHKTPAASSNAIEPTQTPFFSSTTTPTATNTPPVPSDTPLPPSETPTYTPEPLPDLVVVKNAEPEALVRQALQALGGMGKFVPSGAKVVIKPNICVAYRSYEYAATTNPWVVGALVKLCLEAGAASVKVMDAPFNGTQQQAWEDSGIREQVEAAGGQMAYMLPYNYVEQKIPNAVYMKKASICKDILEADVLINVPIAKTHSSSRLTIGMKNMMGVVWDRNVMHNNLSQSIADLNTLVRPQLTVVDAVRILASNGPAGGSLAYVKKMDTVIASQDVVAADSYAASLFGIPPDGLAYIKAGVALGLGRSDLENLRIKQFTIGA